MPESTLYQPRLYRGSMGNDRWRSFTATHLETDLWIAVSAGEYRHNVESFVKKRIVFYREVMEEHIGKYPEFLQSLLPLNLPADINHIIIREMYEASGKAGTGPMSSVAGAIAEYICMDMISEYGFDEVIVENGGDIFMKITSPVVVSVFAGPSPLSGKIGLEIEPEQTPLSVCCSSGTVGHSYSLGFADACSIACRSGALADACATAFGNEIKNIESIDNATQNALKIPDILSVVIIKDDRAGIGGSIKVKVIS